MIKNKTKKGLAVLFSILTIFHSVYASGDKISVKNSNTAHNNKKDSQNNSQKIYSYLEYLGCKVKHFKDRLKDNLKPYWDNVPLKYSVICLMGVVVAVFLPSSSKKDKSKSKTDDIKDDIEEEKKITVATNKNFIDVNHEMLIYVHAISLFVNDPKRALMFDLKNETLEIKTQYIDVINVLDDNFKFPPIQDTINYIISECETKNESEYTSKDSDTETFVFGKSKCDTSYTKDTDYINKVKTAIGRMSKNKKITPDELQQFNTLCLEIKNLKKDLNETLKKDNASAKKIVGTREKIRKIDSRLLHTIKNEILSIISSILEKAGYDDVGNIKKVNPVSVPTSVPVSVPASNKHLVSSDQKLNHTEEIYISGTKFTLKKDNNKLEFNAKVAAKPLLITFFIDSKTIEISGNFGDIVRNNIIGSVYDKTVDLYKSQNFKNYSLFINGDLEICTPMIQVFKNYISKTINPKEITLREGARIICSGPDGIIYIFNKFNEAEMEFSCGYCVDNIAKYDPEYKLIVDTKTKNIKILGLCQKDECEICIAMNSKLKKSLINKCIETVGHMTHDKKGVYTIHFSGNDKKDLEIEFRCFFGIFNNLSGKNLDNLFFEGNVKLIELVNDKEIVKTTLLLEDKKNIMAEVVIGDMKLFISKNSKTVNISSIKLDEEQIKCLIEYIKKIMNLIGLNIEECKFVLNLEISNQIASQCKCSSTFQIKKCNCPFLVYLKEKFKEVTLPEKSSEESSDHSSYKLPKEIKSISKQDQNIKFYGNLLTRADSDKLISEIKKIAKLESVKNLTLIVCKGSKIAADQFRTLDRKFKRVLLDNVQDFFDYNNRRRVVQTNLYYDGDLDDERHLEFILDFDENVKLTFHVPENMMRLTVQSARNQESKEEEDVLNNLNKEEIAFIISDPHFIIDSIKRKLAFFPLPDLRNYIFFLGEKISNEIIKNCKCNNKFTFKKDKCKCLALSAFKNAFKEVILDASSDINFCIKLNEKNYDIKVDEHRKKIFYYGELLDEREVDHLVNNINKKLFDTYGDSKSPDELANKEKSDVVDDDKENKEKQLLPYTTRDFQLILDKESSIKLSCFNKLNQNFGSMLLSSPRVFFMLNDQKIFIEPNYMHRYYMDENGIKTKIIENASFDFFIEKDEPSKPLEKNISVEIDSSGNCSMYIYGKFSSEKVDIKCLLEQITKNFEINICQNKIEVLKIEEDSEIDGNSKIFKKFHISNVFLAKNAKISKNLLSGSKIDTLIDYSDSNISRNLKGIASISNIYTCGKIAKYAKMGEGSTKIHPITVLYEKDITDKDKVLMQNLNNCIQLSVNNGGKIWNFQVFISKDQGVLIYFSGKLLKKEVDDLVGEIKKILSPFGKFKKENIRFVACKDETDVKEECFAKLKEEFGEVTIRKTLKIRSDKGWNATFSANNNGLVTIYGKLNPEDVSDFVKNLNAELRKFGRVECKDFELCVSSDSDVNEGCFVELKKEFKSIDINKNIVFSINTGGEDSRDDIKVNITKVNNSIFVSGSVNEKHSSSLIETIGKKLRHFGKDDTKKFRLVFNESITDECMNLFKSHFKSVIKY